MDLLETMRRLNDEREISSGLEVFGATTIRVWVGDELNGCYADERFRWNQLAEAQDWLIRTANEAVADLASVEGDPDRILEAAGGVRRKRLGFSERSKAIAAGEPASCPPADLRA